jgi:hypothetical protein
MEILGSLIILAAPTPSCRQFSVTFLLPTDLAQGNAVLSYLRKEFIPRNIPLEVS